MKKFFLALFCCATLLGGAELTIGDPAKELADCSFLKGEKVQISGKNPTPTLLFFWSIGYASNQELGKMISAAQSYDQKLRIITIGCDDEAKLREFFLTKDIPFTVVSDNKLTNVNTYLREKEQVPFCVILTPDGKIAWRGPASQVAAPLKAIVDGKYDLATAVRIDRYKSALSDAMEKKDFNQALALTDAELKHNPENLELIVLSVNLLNKALGKPDVAKKRLAELVKNHPRNVHFHEIYLRYLHLLHQRAEILQEADFAAQTFADEPTDLQKLISVETNFPVGEISPEALLRLGKALHSVQKFPNERDHALALLLYAKILSYCNAPGAALNVAMQAKCHLHDSKEIAEADRMIAHYQEILRLSRELQQ